MPASPADSALFRELFGDEETARLFSDSAELRAMLLVEGALAKAQGDLGLIPATAAAYIDRAAREVQIDPAALADQTATNGVPVPGLVAAFRKAANAPEHMQYLHWGATSQDIMDTALMLRLKRVLELWDDRLGVLLLRLADLAEAHAGLPMAGRSYGQVATPTSFGAVVASWGRPVLRGRDQFSGLRTGGLCVSLSGAAGTASALGPKAPALRAALAGALGLADPGASWHSERDRIVGLSNAMAGLAASLGKMGEDLILMTQSGVGEVVIEGGGASSTMPQKQNPVGPSVLVALARQVSALAGLIGGAALHRQQRDGAAWFTEWLTLPQLCISTGRALALATDLAGRIAPDSEAMAHGLDDGLGLIQAEAFSFALAGLLARDEAQAAIKALCAEARATGTSLPALVHRDFGDGATLSPDAMLGEAPAEARAFAQAARRAASA